MSLLARKQVRIGLGLLLILVPAGYLVRHSTSEPAVDPVKARQSVAAIPATAEVLIASAALSRGEVVTAERLGRLQILGTPPEGALSDPRSAEFLVAVRDILAGQIILRSALSAAPAAAGLAVLVPPGERAIALRVSDEIAVGDFLRPGDRADLVVVFAGAAGEGVMRAAPLAASEARIVLQNVEVLTVGAAISGGPPETVGAGGAARKAANVAEVTLAVSPEQAAQIALIRSVASYYLALRNDHDRTTVPEVRASLVDLLGEPVRAPAAPDPAPKMRSVEALIGPKLEHFGVRP